MVNWNPLVKDFLENKILDFFEAYPLMDGIILTLHETKILFLKLIYSYEQIEISKSYI